MGVRMVKRGLWGVGGKLGVNECAQHGGSVERELRGEVRVS